MATIEAGSIIAGKYRVERPLSQGGMGSLWVARHLQLQRLVAVKLMDPLLAATAQGRVRFEREAQAAALIQSPNVVQIHDYGLEQDTPYIVMELLTGEDLGRRLKRDRRLPLPVVAAIFAQITRALRKAHDAGMIHLDLKPANIFLARDDEDEIVKVLDFGIAKMITNDQVTEVTATGVVLGSVHYMSPEQVRGRRGLDHRSDLWSLGVIAFRAITGELPFGGTQIGDVLVKVCADPIPLASTVLPGLPSEVDAFLLRALSRDPEARFQSARDLSAALTLLASPAGTRPAALSISGESTVTDASRVLTGPAVAQTAASRIDLPASPVPIEPGTLTSYPRVADLAATTELGAGARPSWKIASLAAFGVASVIAAGFIGSAALSSRGPGAAVSASAIPLAELPQAPAPAVIPAPPESVREVEIEPPPAVIPAPTAAASATSKPVASPKVAAAIKPASGATPVLAAPKKANPALGF
jgi:serine/threonine-protein kinase